MKNNITIYFLFIAMICFQSCYKYSQFTNITVPITDGKLNARIDGVYFADFQNDKHEGCELYYIFYKDGSVYCGISTSRFIKWRWHEDIFDGLLKEAFWKYSYYKGSRPYYLGAYAVKDSILTIEKFTDSWRGWTFPKIIERQYFKIKNDTLLLYYQECISCPKPYDKKDIIPPVIYSFHKFKIRDTIDPWFKEKKWYDKNADESRK